MKTFLYFKKELYGLNQLINAYVNSIKNICATFEKYCTTEGIADEIKDMDWIIL